MRLHGRCIIHSPVSDRSKINRPDQTLSNRPLTAYFLSRSTPPISLVLSLSLSLSFSLCSTGALLIPLAVIALSSVFRDAIDGSPESKTEPNDLFHSDITPRTILSLIVSINCIGRYPIERDAR